jgi:hypothetical protein
VLEISVDLHDRAVLGIIPSEQKPGATIRQHEAEAKMHRAMRVCQTAALCAAIVMCGCVPVATMGSSGGAAPSRSAAVLGGEIKIRPPSGYCVDPAAGQEADDTAVVMAGRCSDTEPVDPAVMTVAIGRAGSAAPLSAGGAALAAYFTSPEGLAALSRSGQVGDARVTKAYSRDAAFLIHVEDRIAGAYWRSVLGIRGRLVTVSVSAPPGQRLDEASGASLMTAMLTSLARTNPRGGEGLLSLSTSRAGP